MCSIVFISYLSCIADLKQLDQQYLDYVKKKDIDTQYTLEYFTPDEFLNDEKFSGILAIKVKD